MAAGLEGGSTRAVSPGETARGRCGMGWPIDQLVARFRSAAADRSSGNRAEWLQPPNVVFRC
jgi:hypothetical protein